MIRRLAILTALAALSTPAPVAALDNGLALTPPMGWNSWNIFGGSIDETKIKAIADGMVSSGMRDAGYLSINLDDNWMAQSRDSAGNLRADPVRFPNGIKALADYVHARGMKLGIYGDRGIRTCLGVRESGSYQTEERDAAAFASWGVDYLKYDNCNRVGAERKDYERMRDALAKTGKPIVFSICSWGYHGAWMLDAGNLWRTTGDIVDSWKSFSSIVDQNEPLWPNAGPGRWNDPDMLEVGNGGMSSIEYRAHMSMWALMAAPLIAGNDVRTMTQETRDILCNEEVIAVDQDSLGIQGRRVRDDGDAEVWMKPLNPWSGGARAVVLFNRSPADAIIGFSWGEIDLADAPAQLRDLWQHADLGTFTGGYSAKVPAHGAVMFSVRGAPRTELPAGTAFLSDLPWIFAASGYGPVERDRSNGEDRAGDGATMTINGLTYEKGLGVHANSEIAYALEENYSRFTASVGVDDEVFRRNGTGGDCIAGVEFVVYGDGRVLYRSGVMTGRASARKIDVDTSGVAVLRLRVNDQECALYDHADWADAKVWAKAETGAASRALPD